MGGEGWMWVGVGETRVGRERALFRSPIHTPPTLSQDCLAHGRMAAEAQQHSANCSELVRSMTQAAAVLALEPPSSSSSSLGGAGGAGGSGAAGGAVEGAALVQAARGFLSEVEGKRRALEAQLGEVKTINRCARCERGRESGWCMGVGM